MRKKDEPKRVTVYVNNVPNHKGEYCAWFTFGNIDYEASDIDKNVAIEEMRRKAKEVAGFNAIVSTPHDGR